MAINISYQPAAALVGPVAQRAGEGLFQQRQQDRQQAVNEALLRAKLADRQQQIGFAMDQARLAASLQAQQQQQVMDAQRAQWAMGLQLQEQQYNQALRQQQMRDNLAYQQSRDAQDYQSQQVRLAAQLGMQQQQNTAELQMKQQQYDLLNQQQSQQQDMLWQRDGVESQEKQINQLQASLAKQQQNLTPEGQRLYTDLNNKLRAIQRQRASLRPQQYGQLLSQWQQEYDQSGLENHIQEPPTIDQSWKENSIQLDDGSYAVRETNAQGGFQWKQFTPKTEGKAGRGMTFNDHYAEPEKYWSEVNKIKKELYEDRQREAKAAALKSGSADPEAAAANVRIPTDDEARRLLRDRYNAHQEEIGGPINLGNLGLPPQPAPMYGGFGNSDPQAIGKPHPLADNNGFTDLHSQMRFTDDPPPEEFASRMLKMNPVMVHQYLRQKYPTERDVKALIQANSNPYDAALILFLKPDLAPSEPVYANDPQYNWSY